MNDAGCLNSAENSVSRLPRLAPVIVTRHVRCCGVAASTSPALPLSQRHLAVIRCEKLLSKTAHAGDHLKVGVQCRSPTYKIRQLMQHDMARRTLDVVHQSRSLLSDFAICFLSHSTARPISPRGRQQFINKAVPVLRNLRLWRAPGESTHHGAIMKLL